MASYRDASLLVGQQEAIRRVKMAQEKAKKAVETDNDLVMGRAQEFAAPQGNVPTPEPIAPQNQNAQTVGGFPQNRQGGFAQNQQWGFPQNQQQNFPQNPQWNASPPKANDTEQGKPGGRGIGDLFSSKSLGGMGESLNSILSSTASPLKDIMDKFDIDGEKLIIILVMWVIFNEKGDKTLLMALGYLLL